MHPLTLPQSIQSRFATYFSVRPDPSIFFLRLVFPPEEKRAAVAGTVVAVVGSAAAADVATDPVPAQAAAAAPLSLDFCFPFSHCMLNPGLYIPFFLFFFFFSRSFLSFLHSTHTLHSSFNVTWIHKTANEKCPIKPRAIAGKLTNVFSFRHPSLAPRNLFGRCCLILNLNLIRLN